MVEPPRRSLDGLLVVALEQAVAAPLCTARLAEAGARVIKVERAEGDFSRGYDHAVNGDSAYFVWLNRGKQSIALDIKDPADAALLGRLLERADVFIQNLAPGAAERAGFGSAALRARHPRLVTCDITGYGQTGPLAGMKAYDFLIQCEAGLASITGPPDRPSRVGVSVADIACGMNAHAAVLEALLRRARTGEGAALAVSLFDSLADWMSVPLLQLEYGGLAPRRAGLNHATIAPYGAYATGDGRQIVIAIQNEREWASFCREALGDPALAADPRFSTNARRCANRSALDEAIGGTFGALPLGAVIERLEAANTAYGRVNEVAELGAHPQLRRSRGASASGTFSLPAAPAIWIGEKREIPTPAPALDEQGAAIRAEFSPRAGDRDGPR